MTPGLQVWHRLARRRDIVLRAVRVALLVGTVLALINHGDKLIYGGMQTSDYLKILLTYLVPYCVSTYSSVQTVRFDESKPTELV
ncbi:MAG: nitrate/nitrite transporter NrtS [Gammaproteobacteria bacterium]